MAGRAGATLQSSASHGRQVHCSTRRRILQRTAFERDRRESANNPFTPAYGRRRKTAAGGRTRGKKELRERIPRDTFWPARLVSTLVAEFIFYRRRFWNKGNFCDACHKRKYGSLPIYSILDGGLVSRTEAAMATPITQTQPSTVQIRRSCAFGRLAQLFYIAWNDRALMRLAPTRRMGD